jgi:hypothetical protein
MDASNEALTNYIKYEYLGNNVPLVFVQALRGRSAPHTQGTLEVVDSLIEPGSQVYFGSAGFLRSDDGVVRSWRLAEPACKRNRLETIPSVELLLLLIREKKLDQLDGVRSVYSGENCKRPDDTKRIPLGDREIQVSPKHLRDRIVYTIKWLPAEQDNKLTGGVRYVKAKPLFPIRLKQVAQLLREGGGHGWHRPA